ncbi:hypothetical protein DIPPA_35530 [Diplonema papillatum]|nr:hypothetical protein DIPPA_35530 [Diplonema papillatum]
MSCGTRRCAGCHLELARSSPVRTVRVNDEVVCWDCHAERVNLLRRLQKGSAGGSLGLGLVPAVVHSHTRQLLDLGDAPVVHRLMAAPAEPRGGSDNPGSTASEDSLHEELVRLQTAKKHPAVEDATDPGFHGSEEDSAPQTPVPTDWLTGAGALAKPPAAADRRLRHGGVGSADLKFYESKGDSAAQTPLPTDWLKGAGARPAAENRRLRHDGGGGADPAGRPLSPAAPAAARWREVEREVAAAPRKQSRSASGGRVGAVGIPARTRDPRLHRRDDLAFQNRPADSTQSPVAGVHWVDEHAASQPVPVDRAPQPHRRPSRPDHSWNAAQPPRKHGGDGGVRHPLAPAGSRGRSLSWLDGHADAPRAPAAKDAKLASAIRRSPAATRDPRESSGAAEPSTQQSARAGRHRAAPHLTQRSGVSDRGSAAKKPAAARVRSPGRGTLPPDVSERRRPAPNGANRHQPVNAAGGSSTPMDGAIDGLPTTAPFARNQLLYCSSSSPERLGSRGASPGRTEQRVKQLTTAGCPPFLWEDEAPARAENPSSWRGLNGNTRVDTHIARSSQRSVVARFLNPAWDANTRVATQGEPNRHRLGVPRVENSSSWNGNTRLDAQSAPGSQRSVVTCVQNFSWDGNTRVVAQGELNTHHVENPSSWDEHSMHLAGAPDSVIRNQTPDFWEGSTRMATQGEPNRHRSGVTRVESPSSWDGCIADLAGAPGSIIRDQNSACWEGSARVAAQDEPNRHRLGGARVESPPSWDGNIADLAGAPGSIIIRSPHSASWEGSTRAAAQGGAGAHATPPPVVVTQSISSPFEFGHSRSPDRRRRATRKAGKAKDAPSFDSSAPRTPNLADFEGKPAGFEGHATEFESKHAGFEGKHAGFEGNATGFESKHAGFKGKLARFEGNAIRFEGKHAGFEGEHAGSEGSPPGSDSKFGGLERRPATSPSGPHPGDAGRPARADPVRHSLHNGSLAAASEPRGGARGVADSARFEGNHAGSEGKPATSPPGPHPGDAVRCSLHDSSLAAASDSRGGAPGIADSAVQLSEPWSAGSSCGGVWVSDHELSPVRSDRRSRSVSLGTSTVAKSDTTTQTFEDTSAATFRRASPTVSYRERWKRHRTLSLGANYPYTRASSAPSSVSPKTTPRGRPLPQVTFAAAAGDEPPGTLPWHNRPARAEVVPPHRTTSPPGRGAEGASGLRQLQPQQGSPPAGDEPPGARPAGQVAPHNRPARAEIAPPHRTTSPGDEPPGTLPAGYTAWPHRTASPRAEGGSRPLHPQPQRSPGGGSPPEEARGARASPFPPETGASTALRSQPSASPSPGARSARPGGSSLPAVFVGAAAADPRHRTTALASTGSRTPPRTHSTASPGDAAALSQRSFAGGGARGEALPASSGSETTIPQVAGSSLQGGESDHRTPGSPFGGAESSPEVEAYAQFGEIGPGSRVTASPCTWSDTMSPSPSPRSSVPVQPHGRGDTSRHGSDPSSTSQHPLTPPSSSHPGIEYGYGLTRGALPSVSVVSSLPLWTSPASCLPASMSPESLQPSVWSTLELPASSSEFTFFRNNMADLTGSSQSRFRTELLGVHKVVAPYLESRYLSALSRVYPDTNRGVFTSDDSRDGLWNACTRVAFHGTHKNLFPSIFSNGLLPASHPDNLTGAAASTADGSVAHLSADCGLAAVYSSRERQSFSQWRGERAAPADPWPGAPAAPHEKSVILFRFVAGPDVSDVVRWDEAGSEWTVASADLLYPLFVFRLLLEPY